MIFVLLMFGLVTDLTNAEKKACIIGKNNCTGYVSSSTIGNKNYCCDNGFTLQWTEGISGSSCSCERTYSERDCDVGRSACNSANNIIIDGGTIMCCGNFESMNNYKNSMVNGVVLNGCKCVRNLNNNNIGMISSSNFARAMTPAESGHFHRTMNQFSNDMQQWGNTMAQGLNNMAAGLFGFNTAPVVPNSWGSGFRNLWNSFFNRSPGQNPLDSGSNSGSNGARSARVDKGVKDGKPLNEKRQLPDNSKNQFNPQSQTQGINPYLNPLSWLPQFWTNMFPGNVRNNNSGSNGGNVNPNKLTAMSSNNDSNMNLNNEQKVQTPKVTIVNSNKEQTNQRVNNVTNANPKIAVI